MAECFVSDRDYYTYFEPKALGTLSQARPTWSGAERRVGPADRRSGEHERRWEKSRGRRFRLTDRRKA